MEQATQVYTLGRSRLEGTVSINGAKNSALRLLAASLLTADDIFLSNYPASILDAQIHTDMLRALGKSCTVTEDTIAITETAPLGSTLDWQGRSIRNTLLILGALTARTGEASVPLPGGCSLGERKHDLHELVLRTLGAEVWEEHDMLCARAPEGLRGADIHLPVRSTGATENAILCACLAQGTTRIWNPHIRPEIMDLVAMLNSMGARIRVYGQQHIEINGVEGLSGTQHRVIADNMEAITWLIGASITGGDVEIIDFPFAHLEVPLIHLRESGARFYRGENSLIVRGGNCYPIDISTGPYPGINSDMQPLFAVYGLCAQGESRVIDLRFPGRYQYAEQLRVMGAQYRIDGNLLLIEGGRCLTGATVTATDLRAGAALALAGMVANGETVIQDAWQIERGYHAFADKARALGAQLTVRVNWLPCT